MLDHRLTARPASEDRLTHAAAHDSLTGLANRTQLLSVLGECVAAGVPAAVLFVDLDRFKAVNDVRGHLAGDRVLCAVADRICQQVDTSATVGRLAGDEFVIVMPRTTETAAAATAQLIRESVAQPIRAIEGRDVIVTASIGIASTAANEASAEALLGDADMAMYRAKRRGRACIDVFDGALRAARSRRIDLADRLRGALTDQQIEVHDQPIIRFDTGLIVGYEGLARWTDPDLGAVPPSELIPGPRITGSSSFSRHVRFEACREAARWAPAGGEPPGLSVNISAHPLSDPQLPLDIQSALAVTAEGVETPEQAAILRGMGCDTAQGFLYGRPGPAFVVPLPDSESAAGIVPGRVHFTS